MKCKYRVPCPWMPGYYVGCPCNGDGPHTLGEAHWVKNYQAYVDVDVDVDTTASPTYRGRTEKIW